MTGRISFPCFSCGKSTEWLRLTDVRFFCHISVNARCSTEGEVIHSTRDIRKTPRSMVCPITGDQRCHIFGLNAAKVIFNYYAMEKCDRIDDETLFALVKSINDKQNIVCCSAQKNLQDKTTEEEFLDCFLYRRKPFVSLSEEAMTMYDAMRRVYMMIQMKHPSQVIATILKDFESVIK